MTLTGTWIHKKTGNKYVVERSDLLNCTNAQNGQRMVMYRPYGTFNIEDFFVREENEFQEKFEFDGDP